MGYPVVAKRTIGQNVTRLTIRAPRIARKRRPGQFVIVRPDAASERIPLTVLNADPVAGSIELVIQAVGVGTRKIVGTPVGGELLDVAGPLGRPTEIEAFGTCVIVSGGVGTGVGLPIARALYEHGGNRVISVTGFRSKDLVLFEEDVRAVSHEHIVTTDDGTYGRKGLVTDVLRELIAREGEGGIALVVTIGPVIMMKFVAETTRPFGIRTVASLNPIMVDGTGMCGGCRVDYGGETRFVCVDGPEMDAHKVDFDGLMRRLGAYREAEKLALDEHDCRLAKVPEGRVQDGE